MQDTIDTLQKGDFTNTLINAPELKQIMKIKSSLNVLKKQLTGWLYDIFYSEVSSINKITYNTAKA